MDQNILCRKFILNTVILIWNARNILNFEKIISNKNDVNQASVLTILGNRSRRRENTNFIYEIFSQKNINQTIYLSIEPAIYQTTYLSIEPAIYQTTYLSIEPSIYRTIYLSEDGRKLIDGRFMELFRYNMGLSKGGSLGYEVPQSNAMRRYRCQSQIYRLMIKKNASIMYS